ncbi:MAG: type II secretion system protein [Synergistaceae bacterium]|nr:type II secretion system protein [Synergistaceae bacterium]
MSRRPGFTLIEILVATALTGVVTALALAPVAMTVQRVVRAQNGLSGTLALERTTAFIGRELAGAVRLAGTAVIVEDHQVLGGGEDDVLIVMTDSPARQQAAAGSVVYKLEQGGPLRGTLAGLYRWHFPGKLPEEVDMKNLRGEDGQLVLPGATAFSVEIPEGTERRKEYKGELPIGIYVGLTRGAKGEEESFEQTLVFP